MNGKPSIFFFPTPGSCCLGDLSVHCNPCLERVRSRVENPALLDGSGTKKARARACCLMSRSEVCNNSGLVAELTLTWSLGQGLLQSHSRPSSALHLPSSAQPLKMSWAQSRHGRLPALEPRSASGMFIHKVLPPAPDNLVTNMANP